MKLKQQLQQLQSVKASTVLKQKIQTMTDALPAKHRGFYFPLMTFQTAVALGVLLLLLGIGSGLVAGAKESHPGNIFYPVKELIEKIPREKPGIKQVISPVLVPTNTPVPTPGATISGQLHEVQDKKNIQDKPSHDIHQQDGQQGSKQHEDPIQKKEEETKSQVQKFFKNIFHEENHTDEKDNSSAHQGND